MDFTPDQRKALTEILHRLERGEKAVARMQLLYRTNTEPSVDMAVIPIPVLGGYFRAVDQKAHPELAAMRTGTARLRALLSP